ncbi:citrate/2-methylcitrate synthase [Pigmentiphaga litoralis]|uniref:citrate/2-methylcitrate synthase n=1 Tax=Pigmentiphaga litoralis TaxID=516702 RepID=UPI00389ACBCD
MTDSERHPARTNAPEDLPGTVRRVNDVEYVDRAKALIMLGVKKESLYTYVSRGLIKAYSEPGKKTSLYRKSDLEKLKTRTTAKGASKPVAQVLRYGEPILQTWVCEVTSQGPRYRGQLATDLARAGRSLEYVADLIWSGLPPIRDKPWPRQFDKDAERVCLGIAGSGAPAAPLRMLAGIALESSALAAPDRDRHLDIRGSGVKLLSGFAGISGYFGPKPGYQRGSTDEFIADRVLRGFGLEASKDRDEARSALTAALTLSVDNELSAPTFCARIAASTGVDAFACVAAALMAQAGPMQAGGVMDLEDFFDDLFRSPAPRSVPAARTLSIPCFDHPLYEQDPRAELLLKYVQALPDPMGTRDTLLSFLETVSLEGGGYPNLFAALVVLSRTLGLPRGTAVYLHSLGRTAGWLAHITEQRLTGVMLRPRAYFMGSPSERRK